MPTIQIRRVSAQTRGIGGGVMPPSVKTPQSAEPPVTETTLEQQLQKKRAENPDGYLPDNMRQITDVPVVRGKDAYNAAQTAAEFIEHIAAVAPHMARAAGMAESEGDFVLAEQIDDMMREAAAGRFRDIGNWLTQSKLGRGVGQFLSGKPKNWDDLEEWESTTGKLNPEAWSWDHASPLRRDHYVRNTSHKQPLNDKKFHQPFSNIGDQQQAWGSAQHVQAPHSERVYNVRTPEFSSLNEQINFDRKLNTGLGLAGVGAGAAGAATIGSVTAEAQRKSEYQQARRDYQSAGGASDPKLAQAYSAYVQAILSRSPGVGSARASFQALLRRQQPIGASRIRASIRFAAAKQGRDKGNLEWHGLKLYIENPKGTWREKTDTDGKKWRRKMAADYGRINGTKGADGDCIDAFVGPSDESTMVYVVDQVDKTGKFDEHKCVLGCKSRTEARALYLANYPKGWKAGEVTEFTLPQFQKWIKKGDIKSPAAKK